MELFREQLSAENEQVGTATNKLQAEAKRCMIENYSSVVGGGRGQSGPEVLVCYPADALQRYFHPQPEISIYKR